MRVGLVGFPAPQLMMNECLTDFGFYFGIYKVSGDVVYSKLLTFLRMSCEL